MADTLTPVDVNTSILDILEKPCWNKADYVIILRCFLRDSIEQNTIYCNKRESTDTELCIYIWKALQYFNEFIPVTYFKVETFPFRNWLLMRAVIEQQFSLGFLHTRNTADFNAGGRAIRDFGKQSTHLSFISALIAQTESMRAAHKKNINAQAFYGVILSEYSYVNNYIQLD